MVCEMDTITAATLTREERFGETYERAFPAVARFVNKMNGSFQDAKDIFHDAMIIFFEKTAREPWHVYGADEAYILGIAKHLWLRQYRADRDTVGLDAFEATLSIPADYFPSDGQNRILRVLERVGRKCMGLLQAFYYEKKTMQTITSQFGYSNARTATVQKHKCLEKVRNLVREKALQYEDLID